MTAFLIIGGAGLLLLVVSFVLGDVFDGLLEGLGGGEFFSAAAATGFLAAFGFGGALALSSGANGAVAVVAGLLAGALIAFVVQRFTRSLSQGQTDATPTTAGLAGRSGTVVSDVPAGGYGTVSVTISGHVTRLNARADEPLPAGTAVSVVTALSPTSVQVSRLA